MSFSALGLTDELVRAVERLGFEAPTPIQERAIPALLSSNGDFVGLARTGTGKTAAFGLPLIQYMEKDHPHPMGLVICPTRELCLQIADDLRGFASYRKNVNIVAVYGGEGMVSQIRELKKNPTIVVATPGRLIDLAERGVADLSHVTHVVLDEADEMLRMGFQEDIDDILGRIPAGRRIWLFSATMAPGVSAVANKYLSDPMRMSATEGQTSPDTMTHTCYVIHEKHRYEGLKRLIDHTPDMLGLVFCRTRKETQEIAESLLRDGHDADSLHGDLSQEQRSRVMRKFREGLVRILVATDVAARGIDVDNITHVIHYQFPEESETYTHRSGRTARAGRSGASIVLVNTRQVSRVKELERRGGLRFTFAKLPSEREIREKCLVRMAEAIAGTEIHAEADTYLPAVRNAFDHMDREELIRRLVSAECLKFRDHGVGAEDINAPLRSGGYRGDRIEDRGSVRGGFRNRPETKPRNGAMRRYFINVGRLDNINESAIVRLICDKSGIRSHLIGDIRMKREFSFFEVEKSAASRIERSLKNAQLDGRRVEISAAPDQKPVAGKERRF